MYELIQAGEKTFYMNSPSKVGFYKLDEKNVCLIDSGNDREAGRKIHQILVQNNWNLAMIINTHHHSDHVGGNKFLQKKYSCKVFSTKINNFFIENQDFNSAFLYGGFTSKEFQDKLFLADLSDASELIESELPDGIELIRLDGHSLSMLGIKTSDDVWFLADLLISEVIIKKYPIFFLYDVKTYLNSLAKVEKLTGNLFVLSHAKPLNDIKPLVEVHRNKVYEIIENIRKICEKPSCFDDVLKQMLDIYSIPIDCSQYILIGSTIRSYLSYMCTKKILEIVFQDNYLLWKKI